MLHGPGNIPPGGLDARQDVRSSAEDVNSKQSECQSDNSSLSEDLDNFVWQLVEEFELRPQMPVDNYGKELTSEGSIGAEICSNAGNTSQAGSMCMNTCESSHTPNQMISEGVEEMQTHSFASQAEQPMATLDVDSRRQNSAETGRAQHLVPSSLNWEQSFPYYNEEHVELLAQTSSASLSAAYLANQSSLTNTVPVRASFTAKPINAAVDAFTSVTNQVCQQTSYTVDEILIHL